ncbi:MAG: D-tyrosyl-tRNA(Tyr) deacylase [Candidatus Marinimicrobia bacterium]|nr:D-tyrosyl-tRNA(Tyr) deacylase [Candidatus Neomarinimicrobiota bacterium]|tara:strand:+ start:1017 stop:1463 length:447 start_codon:yes stop_codon:yes gene_type:complete
MIAVIQRCSKGEVSVDGEKVGKIGLGIIILLGIEKGDSINEVDLLVNKIINLRIFNDKNQKMNLSLKDIDGSALVISQFTLCGNIKKGRRPSFLSAANHLEGEKLYKFFIDKIKENSIIVESGKFGSMMKVALVNDGPVTFFLDSKKL